VAVLSNGGRQFLVVVNRDLHEPMPLSAALVPWTVFHRVAKDGTLHGAGGTHGAGGLLHEAKVEPGDVYVLTWQPRQK
jgi:hypothetical protein